MTLAMDVGLPRVRVRVDGEQQADSAERLLLSPEASGPFDSRMSKNSSSKQRHYHQHLQKLHQNHHLRFSGFKLTDGTTANVTSQLSITLPPITIIIHLAASPCFIMVACAAKLATEHCRTR
jgi:hypothetical protein